MTATPARILIIRGDLRSNYGYSRALRAHLGLLRPYFDEVFGADIHFHPNRSKQPFPGTILKDAELDALASKADVRATLLNYTTPDNFRRMPGAHNIGLFYWETDRYNPQVNFGSCLNLMDAIWLPVPFMRGAVEKSGFKGRIFVFPWPHDFANSTEAAPAGDIPIYQLSLTDKAVAITSSAFDAVNTFPRLRRRPTLALAHKIADRSIRRQRVSLAEFRQKYKTLYLAVMQNVPRKGLNILVTEWLSHVKNSAPDAALVLKVSSLNPEFRPSHVYLEALEKIRQSAKAQGVRDPQLGLCVDSLSETQLHGLYENVDALVSTTLGEGFGGPMVEAAQHELPLICPRHTSLESIIPPQYPLTPKSRYVSISLRDQLHYYSLSSLWGVTEGGEIEHKLRLFEQLPPERKRELGRQIKDHAAAFCGAPAVERLLGAEMEEVARASSR